ncbi:MAG: hypothetical protein ABIH59_02710 [archaeon]
MDLVERCVNQVFRTNSIYLGGQLLNNCSICSYDPLNNKKCPYRGKPMRMFVVKIEKRVYEEAKS